MLDFRRGCSAVSGEGMVVGKVNKPRANQSTSFSSVGRRF
ncbi:hypothetical protein CASFOL_028889 [Castilleja foliolosa]|uniref:Uncharacterized protein n=1 Tax=Castilleja foliolosa TaxID=1961234 RepID=A0ABD3CDY1_9LAMI